MRLINVSTLEMEEFPAGKAPPYAILSHTWGQDHEEMTLRDMYDKINRPGNGSFKIQKCCQQAKQDGLQYAWVDTCCIDKTNAVELTEAINSMFRWYRGAAVCYAYLSDVSGAEFMPKLHSSRWFMRGWTLQELLAPKTVQFYNMDWNQIGTKADLCMEIEQITGIPQHYLLGLTELQEASVAQRMSWASKRTTTRTEDLAYCLLGIFDVSMPMVYGEGGAQAFFRLQEEIMKRVRDDSLLAWGLGHDSPGSGITAGRILATGPSDFAGCADIVCRESSTVDLAPMNMSGGRLRIHLPVFTTSDGDTVGILNCGPEDDAQQVV
ncbi:heterokaryon incompatibility protein-domain-containing protein, partial [Stachybotrys elegans]